MDCSADLRIQCESVNRRLVRTHVAGPRREFRIQQDWAGAQESAFPTRTQVMKMTLAWEPHFEKLL